MKDIFTLFSSRKVKSIVTEIISVVASKGLRTDWEGAKGNVVGGVMEKFFVMVHIYQN